MFPYFGRKKRLAPLYPPPVFGHIIEPFAGSAAYACRYPDRAVTLIDKDPDICAVWRYLIGVDAARIMALPTLATGDQPWDVPGLEEPERLLLALYVGWNREGGRVRRTMTSNSRWVAEREKVAAMVERIRHWQVIEGSYEDAPDVRASWFIDPPYVTGEDGVGGSNYRCGNDAIDYAHLGGWCRSRRGQVIVCEYDAADWLPFRPLAANVTQHARRSVELVFYQGPQRSGHIGQSVGLRS